MRSKLGVMALLLATALQAGCLATPASSESIGPAPNGPSSTVLDEPARTTRPPSGPQPSTMPPQPVKQASADPTWASVDVKFQGRTPERFCRNGDHPYPSGCMTFRPGDNTSVSLGGLATPVFLRGHLTWNAPTWSSDHLVAYLIVGEDREHTYGQKAHARATGESPLRVSFDVSRFAGETIRLGITNDECMLDSAPAANCALAGSGGVEPGQEFSFEGKLTGWD